MKSSDTKKLIRNYQQVKAPAHVLTRVRARTTANEKPEGWSWAPLVTAAGIVAAIVLIFSGDSLAPHPGEEVLAEKVPTMTSIAALNIEKPSTGMINLSRVRNVSTPALPAKPVVSNNADKSQDKDTRTRIFNEEKYNEFG